MPEVPVPESLTPTVSSRIESFRKEIEYLVAQGGEQPQFEFKRSVSVSREDLEDRFDFIKLLQGVANAENTIERCIVIGADPKTKKFYPISNAADFDGAKIFQILDAYLEPVPRFEIFSLASEAGDPYITIVLHANQPCPVVIKKQGHIQSGGKTRLEVGDIWIKKNTALVRATRSDINSMYTARIEDEAEDRARKRLKHLQELTTVAPGFQTASKRQPDFTILVGPKNELRTFVNELILDADVRRFRMLLELAREFLVDRWNDVRGAPSTPPSDTMRFTENLISFFRDEFYPAINSIVTLALLIIKNRGEELWLVEIGDLLVEAFEASKGLNWLKSSHMLQQENVLPWWKPAFEIFISLRTVATYAIARNRLIFLGTMLSRMVVPITIDDRSLPKSPILFWPLHHLDLPEGWHLTGRGAYLWKERISSAWGEYFGTTARFTSAWAELELLLEFNSFVGINAPGDPKLASWLEQNKKNVSFTYYPDFYSQDLQATVPMAERFYETLATPGKFPPYLTVDSSMFEQLFGDKPPARRLQILGQFLYELKAWQSTTMMQQYRRFPFFFAWEGRLRELADEHLAREKAKAKSK